MSFPSEKELKKIRKKLEKVEPSRMLPKNASKVDRLKYELCKKFVIYLLHNKLSQAELARKLHMDRARLNEIVKYRIDLFTLDKLIHFAEQLDPNLDVRVA